jgi:hypothetical protein
MGHRRPHPPNADHGGLTVTLAVVYFGSVVLLQALFQRVAYGQFTIAIVLSTSDRTLFTSCAGHPARHRPTLYRSTTPSTLAVASSLRDQVDGSSHLVSGRRRETMQPEYISLYTKGSP